MKEYSIFLKDQPEGMLFLYMLAYRSSISARSSIGIESPDILVTLKKALQGAHSETAILQTVQDFLKRGFEQFSDELHIEADMAVAERVFRSFNNSVSIAMGVESLSRRDTSFNGRTAFALTSSMNAIRKRYRFLYELYEDTPLIDTSLLQRYFFLRDIDNQTLTNIDEEILDLLGHKIPSDSPCIDNMTLDELDYVYLDD